MGLFIAQQEGTLSAVDSYGFSVAGAEYNVAVGMARLGHTVNYVTKLGQDPFGQRIIRGMEQNGLATHDIMWSDSNLTGFMLKGKTAIGDPEIFYFRKGSAASCITAEDVRTIDLGNGGYLHMTGIFPAISTSCYDTSLDLMRRAKDATSFISFDPNLRPTLWPTRDTMVASINKLAALSDLVLPGISEGEILTGSRDPAAIAAFYHKLGVKTVVVKLGAAGAYASDSKESVTVPGYMVRRVVDTVGAGDGFAVGVVSALMEGLPLVDAVRRGNAIGALQVMHIGDSEGLPTRQQLKEFIDREVC